jgi:tRNA A-37 threonylcarbamoyl transferase component Bud32
MAMEYFPEGDLYAYICNHEALAEEECSLITSQILSGIALMHEEGFAHRDVKPQASQHLLKQPQHLTFVARIFLFIGTLKASLPALGG